jgi:formamidopyrimidine-DNA glycosylase
MNPDLNERAVDALDVTTEYLQLCFDKKQRINIKAFLLDQQIIGGIGNAYSDEILWHAKISPKSIVGGIPAEVVDRLAHSIKTVLTNAVEYLRKNHSGILSGEVRSFLAVHNPKIKTSPTGYPVIIEQIASKKTYYTEEQVLY